MALPCPARSAPRMLPTWALCHLGQTTTPASAPTQISCWTVLGVPGAARGRSFGVNFEDFFRHPRQAGQGRRPAQLGPRAVAFDGGIWVDFFRSPQARQTPASPGHHARRLLQARSVTSTPAARPTHASLDMLMNLPSTELQL